MATRIVEDRPFKDLEVLDSGPRGGSASTTVTVDSIDAVVPVEEVYDDTDDTDDPLSPARGILLALLLASPFWIGVVYWLVW
jgi:hypothetical protein